MGGEIHQLDERIQIQPHPGGYRLELLHKVRLAGLLERFRHRFDQCGKTAFPALDLPASYQTLVPF